LLPALAVDTLIASGAIHVCGALTLYFGFIHGGVAGWRIGISRRGLVVGNLNLLHDRRFPFKITFIRTFARGGVSLAARAGSWRNTDSLSGTCATRLRTVCPAFALLHHLAATEIPGLPAIAVIRLADLSFRTRSWRHTDSFSVTFTTGLGTVCPAFALLHDSITTEVSGLPAITVIRVTDLSFRAGGRRHTDPFSGTCTA
jgi:hypothetical protein